MQQQEEPGDDEEVAALKKDPTLPVSSVNKEWQWIVRK
jgi:hypothetical protein